MRTKNVFKNIISGIGGFAITIFTNFIVRTVFITFLGIEYLGINGLFSNIITILSITNLGIGTSIVHSFYKPIADNDRVKIVSLLNFYKKLYWYLAGLFALLGILLLPFLNYFIKDSSSITNIYIVYGLFLANSVISYFNVYKSSLINANQKNYMISNINNGTLIITSILQIALLFLTKSYIVFLIIHILCTIIQNALISYTADKLYPYIKDKNYLQLSKAEKDEIFKNVKSVILYRIGTIITNGTDNIILSTFIGLQVVGIYNNYLLIINSVIGVLSRITNSMTSSIGNMAIVESEDKQYQIFNVIFFANSWIYLFCSTSLLFLLNPFINLWLGKEYLLDKSIIFVIVLNFYYWGMQNTTNNFRVAMGLFQQGKYRPILASVVNLCTSLILVRYIGTIGVFIGTLISIFSFAVWYDPIIVHKYGFKRSVMPYFVKYLKANIVFYLTVGIVFLINARLNSEDLVTFIIKMGLCIIIPNILIVVLYRKSDEMNYFRKVIQNFRNRKKKTLV